jgi:hypothetical protein
VQIRRQGLQHAAQRALLDPSLKAAMTGLIGGIAIGEVLPRRPRAENPENPIQHVARIAPRTAPTIATESRLRQERGEHRPLGIGEIHIAEYDDNRNFVSRPRVGL